jgi:ATP-binding cassette, subfamily C, bacterial CydCD
MPLSRRLLALTKANPFSLAATIFFGFLGGLLTILQAAWFSRAVSQVFLGGQTLVGVTVILRWLLLVILLRSILTWAGEVSAAALAVRIKDELRRRLFDKILRLGPVYARGERTGELSGALVEGVEALDAYFSRYLPQLVVSALVPLSILFFVFPDDPLSGLVLLLTGPLIPLFMYLIGKTAESLTRRQWDSLSRLGAHFLDSLQGLTTLKELGCSKDQAVSIDAASNRFRDMTLKVLRVTFLSALVLELVATISTAVVAVEVSLRLYYGQLGFQQALFLLLLAPEFYLPLRMLGLRFHAGMAGTSAARRIFEILDAAEVLPARIGGVATSYAKLHGLRIADVSYTFPGEKQPLLKNIDLSIKAGDHVALVGPSGAGKSTLIALLLGFIQPDCGQISLDPDTSLPEQIAWVPQSPHLFHASIAANLRLGKADASQNELEAAARAAHLDAFIQSLPVGYETVIGEDGARLSGGEAQRLALARAFLRNSPILILDEPTSSLDPANEALLEDSIHRLMQGRTIITIAHRLNTVFQADKIFVMEKGSIVQVGDHLSLLASGGLYSRLVDGSVNLEHGDLNFQPQPVETKANEELPHPTIMDVDGIPGKQVSAVSVLLRLLGFLRGSWGWVALSVLLGSLTIGGNIGLMGTSTFLISIAALQPQFGALQLPIVSVRFFGLTRGIFRYAERLVTHRVTFTLLAQLRAWFYRALEPLAPARLLHYRSGDLLARIIADVDVLEDFYVRVIAPPFTAAVIAAVMFIYFGRYDLHLALTHFGFMVALGLVLPLFSGWLNRRHGAEVITRRASIHSLLVDGLHGLPDLLAFSQATDYYAQIDQAGKSYGHAQLRLARVTGLTSGSTVFLVNLGMLAVLALTIPLVDSGKVAPVMLAALAIMALASFEAVMPIPLATQNLSSGLQAARRLLEVVDTPAEVVDWAEANLSVPARPSIQFKGLHFTYPGANRPALSGFNLDLPPGKRVAIVGPSGAGKSTLSNLLLRFLDYRHGEIWLDGQDLHKYPQEEVRRLVSVASQRNHFFNTTIRRNMLLANTDAGEVEMRQAARQAHIDEFICGLPNGYDTRIGEGGLRLSGGELQRLVLARAYLKDAPILLLDEPAANLDPLTEAQILETLFSTSRDQTLILITHRLARLEGVDEILVLNQGRVVERGTFRDLLAARGLFRQLWEQERRLILDKFDT